MRKRNRIRQRGRKKDEVLQRRRKKSIRRAQAAMSFDPLQLSRFDKFFLPVLARLFGRRAS